MKPTLGMSLTSTLAGGLLTLFGFALLATLPVLAEESILQNNDSNATTLPSTATMSASSTEEDTSKVNRARRNNSRLNQLLKKQPKLFLPAQVRIGEDNQYVLQGKAGDKVTLIYSFESSGFSAPNGLSLRVGKANDHIEGVIPENGVLALTIPVPEIEGIEEADFYVDAYTWQAEDYSDLQQVVFTDASGRETRDNHMVLAKAVNKHGLPGIMPNMPGLPPQVLQQMTQMTDQNAAYKEYADPTLNKDRMMDKNPFIQQQVLPSMGGR